MDSNIIERILTTSGPMALIVLGGLWWFTTRAWPAMLGAQEKTRDQFSEALKDQQKSFSETLNAMTLRFDAMQQRQMDHCDEHRKEIDKIVEDYRLEHQRRP